MVDREDIEQPQVHTPFFSSNGANGHVGGKYRSTENSGVEEKGKEPSPKIGHCRFYIFFLVTLVCSALTANAFAFTYAAVLGSSQDWPNVTRHTIDPRRDMSLPRTWHTGLLYSSAPLANVLGVTASVLMMGRIRIRYHVMASLLLSAIPTVLIIYTFELDTAVRVPLIGILRFVQGLGSSVMVPLIINLLSNWTVLEEVSLMLAIVSSQAQIGVMYTSLTAGILCDIFGWRCICRLSAAFSAFLIVPWAIFYYDKPSASCCLAKEEKDLLSRDRMTREPISSYRAFFKEMLSTLTIWAVLVAAFGSYGGISPLFLFQTTILKRSLKLTNRETCLVAFVTSLMHLVFKGLACLIFFKGGGNPTWRMKCGNFAACGFTGLMFLAVASGRFEDKYVIAGILGFAQAFAGFSYSAFHNAAMVVNNQYSWMFMVCFLSMSIFTSIFEPVLIARFASDHTWSQWRVLIVFHGILLIFSNVCYYFAVDARSTKIAGNAVKFRKSSDNDMVELPPPNEMAD